MTATAQAYSFGARAPYAEPCASEYDVKERARLSGLFPRVRNEPLSKQLQGLLKEFEQNAALTGILERRRRMDERLQYELQGREGMRALEMNRTPPLRAGMAGAATSARVAAAIAGLPAVPPAPDAAAVMTGGTVPAAVPGGGAGVSGQGGSTGSGTAVAGAQEVVSVPAGSQQEHGKPRREGGGEGDGEGDGEGGGHSFLGTRGGR